MEKAIRLRFIRAISDNERKLIALQIIFGGLDLLDYCETQNIEYQNSSEVTKDLTENINLQNKSIQINTENIKLKSDKNFIYQKKINEVTINMDEKANDV